MNKNIIRLLVVAAAVLPGCAPDAVSTARVRQSVPEKTEDVAPKVSSVRDTTEELGRSATVAEEKARAASREVRTLRDLLESSTNKAELLSKQGAATARDLEELWFDFRAAERQGVVLQERADAVSAELEAQKVLRARQSAEIKSLETAAAESDREKAQLRLQLSDESAAADMHADEARRNADAAAKAAALADTRKGVIRMLWVAVGALGFLFLAACGGIYLRR